MSKKKKEEEEVFPPEHYLPEGYTLECQVFWCGERRELEGAAGSLKCGSSGVLVAATLTEERTIEVVDVRFDDLGEEAHSLPLNCLLLQPPDLGQWDELSTGLQLPLRGKDIDRIWAMGDDPDMQARLIAEHLSLESKFPAAARLEIVRDFYVFNLAQAKALCLSGVQAAVFLAAMGSALEVLLRKSNGDLCSREACFKDFQRIILAHSANDPPRRLQILRDSDVRLLTDFASETLFKHFLLYQYCLNCDREVHVLRFGVGLECPLPPPDLNGARLHRRKAQEVLPPPQEAPNGGVGGGYPDPAAEGGEAGSRDLPGQGEVAGEGGAGGAEDSVERLVQEKLRETEARLQAKLDAREDAFKKKLEAGKGKK